MVEQSTFEGIGVIPYKKKVEYNFTPATISMIK